MLYLRKISTFLLFLFMVFTSLAARADTLDDPVSEPSMVVTPSSVQVIHQEITSPAPAAKETIITPTGYISCSTIKARWHGHTWVSEHRSCHYKKAKVWVDSYWACTKHKQGICTRWQWKSGHWEKS